MTDFLVFGAWPLLWGIIGFAAGWAERAHHDEIAQAARTFLERRIDTRDSDAR